MLIENMDLEFQKNLLSIILKHERGKFSNPFYYIKWWGRRSSILARALIISTVLNNNEKRTAINILSEKLYSDSIRHRTNSKIVFDPFMGSGTFLLEAYKLGFNVVGIDISPVAFKIAKLGFDYLSKQWRNKIDCIVDSLIETYNNSLWMWRTSRGIIIHSFLVRCTGNLCEIPILLKVNRDSSQSIKNCLVLNSDGKIIQVSYSKCKKYRPVEPTIKVNPDNLPSISHSYKIYALEIINSGRREFISLMDDGSREVLFELINILNKINNIYKNDKCTPIPYMKETRRLLKNNIKCWEQLFTYRQLITLNNFIKSAEKRGCESLARLIVGSVSRTTSLLAFYYQPYGKVNPGLVIKSYWIPKYPVELNPVAFAYDRNNVPKSIGRGTLATVIRRLISSSYNRIRLLYNDRAVILKKGNALDEKLYPKQIDLLITDPPYPFMQSYRELELLYEYWLESDSSWSHISDFNLITSLAKLMKNVSPRMRKGKYAIFFLGASTNNTNLLIKIIHNIISNTSFGLRKIYWFLGEQPGVLGRSRAKGVFILVFRKYYPNNIDAVNPLLYVDELIDYIIRLNPKWEKMLDKEFELYRVNYIYKELRNILSTLL